jgi:hypothetical protein
VTIPFGIAEAMQGCGYDVVARRDFGGDTMQITWMCATCRHINIDTDVCQNCHTARGLIPFRKKPVEVLAARWFKNGDHPADQSEVMHDRDGNTFLSEGKVVEYWSSSGVSGDQTCELCSRPLRNHGRIDTVEGGYRVCPGDWIVTGIKGERYPVKPDIFEATYEPVKPS